MFKQLQVVVFLLSILLWRTSGQFMDYTFPLEYAQPGNWVWRSNAENYKTLRLDQSVGKAVTVHLCPAPANRLQPVMGHIKNIRYSNDGASETILIKLSGVRVGRFVTIPKWNGGNAWNVFHNTTRLGRDFHMDGGGKYQLKLSALTDEYGVELDYITIRARNQMPGVDLICWAEVGSA